MSVCMQVTGRWFLGMFLGLDQEIDILFNVYTTDAMPLPMAFTFRRLATSQA